MNETLDETKSRKITLRPCCKRSIAENRKFVAARLRRCAAFLPSPGRAGRAARWRDNCKRRVARWRRRPQHLRPGRPAQPRLALTAPVCEPAPRGLVLPVGLCGLVTSTLRRPLPPPRGGHRSASGLANFETLARHWSATRRDAAAVKAPRASRAASTALLHCT